MGLHFLRGTANITDWWRSLSLLEEKAWTLFLPCSLPPSTSTPRHQEIRHGVLAGGRMEGYRILSSGCQNICHRGEVSGLSAHPTALGCQTRKGGALPSVEAGGDGAGAGQWGAGPGRPAKQSKAPSLPPISVYWVLHGPLRRPALLEFCSYFPRASILHALAPPRAVTHPHVCLLSPALSTVSPGMMSLASSEALLPSFQTLALLLGGGISCGGPAASSSALLLLRLFSGCWPPHVLCLCLPRVSLFHPFSLSLLPIRYWSSLPGSARFGVAPSREAPYSLRGSQPCTQAPRPEAQPFTWAAPGEGGREGLGIPSVQWCAG